MTSETRQNPSHAVSHDKRITDRTGLVHIVTDLTDTWVKTGCGLGFSRGSGSPRVWQLARGHHHEICITCKRVTEQLSDSERPAGLSPNTGKGT
jgi:hypothetical protein